MGWLVLLLFVAAGSRGELADLRIREAVADEDVALVGRLFAEYQEKLIEAEGQPAAEQVCFQSFEQELGDLRGHYLDRDGVLLLAVDDRGPLGCVGVRRLDEPGVCELKRLYVRARGRRRGVGRALTVRAMAAARQLGYKRIVLDTLPTMHKARALYASLGFRERDAFYEGAPVETVYYERDM